MRMPDIDSTVFTAQAGPPTSYAELNIVLVRRGDLLAGRVAGAGGAVDEGVARDARRRWRRCGPCRRARPSRCRSARSPRRCRTSPLAPERESEPSTRMSCEPLSTSSGRSRAEGGVDVDALDVAVELEVRVSRARNPRRRPGRRRSTGRPASPAAPCDGFLRRLPVPRIRPALLLCSLMRLPLRRCSLVPPARRFSVATGAVPGECNARSRQRPGSDAQEPGGYAQSTQPTAPVVRRGPRAVSGVNGPRYGPGAHPGSFSRSTVCTLRCEPVAERPRRCWPKTRTRADLTGARAVTARACPRCPGTRRSAWPSPLTSPTVA